MACSLFTITGCGYTGFVITSNFLNNGKDNFVQNLSEQIIASMNTGPVNTNNPWNCMNQIGPQLPSYCTLVNHSESKFNFQQINSLFVGGLSPNDPAWAMPPIADPINNPNCINQLPTDHSKPNNLYYVFTDLYKTKFIIHFTSWVDFIPETHQWYFDASKLIVIAINPW